MFLSFSDFKLVELWFIDIVDTIVVYVLLWNLSYEIVVTNIYCE